MAAVCLGVPLAVLSAGSDLPGRNLLHAASVVPLLIPPYVQGIVWVKITDALKGTVDVDIHTRPGVIFVLAVSYFPFVFITTVAGIRSLDRNLQEASLICRGKGATLGRIILPLLTPHVVAGAGFVFVFSLMEFGVPDLLRVPVYPVEIFIQYSALYNPKAALALSLPPVLTAFALLAVQRAWMRERSYIQLSAGAGGGVAFDLGRFLIPAAVFCVSIVGCSVLLPLGTLLKAAGGFQVIAGVFRSSYSQVFYSLIPASAGAGITLVLGFCLAYLVDRGGTRMKLLSYPAVLPLAVPPVTLGIGLIGVWNRPVLDWVYGSSAIVVIAYTARFLPFSFLVAASGLKQVGVRLEEAASFSTANRFRVMGRIVLPLIKDSAATAFFFVFVLSFQELGTTLLVVPPGRETVPLKIYNLLHYGAHREVAALCLIQIALLFVVYLLFTLLRWKWKRS